MLQLHQANRHQCLTSSCFSAVLFKHCLVCNFWRNYNHLFLISCHMIQPLVYPRFIRERSTFQLIYLFFFLPRHLHKQARGRLTPLVLWLLTVLSRRCLHWGVRQSATVYNLAPVLSCMRLMLCLMQPFVYKPFAVFTLEPFPPFSTC